MSITYDHLNSKSAGADSDVVGVTEHDVELCWSRSDLLRRNEVSGKLAVDVRRNAALSTHAAIEALADRLDMLFNVLI